MTRGGGSMTKSGNIEERAKERERERQREQHNTTEAIRDELENHDVIHVQSKQAYDSDLNLQGFSPFRFKYVSGTF